MLFNSGVFFQFFAAFLLLYWLLRNHLRGRNLLIVGASYLFYGWWNVKFLALLFFSSVLDFAVGRGLARLTSPGSRRLLLAASITVNLGILGFFKYYNFFVDSMRTLLARLDVPFHPGTLDVILPVGISFYTFQSMSYAIDVYRRHFQPTRNFVNFLAYVSFFPQLVAGPIQRAADLLPQFERTRVITRAMVEEGIWLLLWGLFKKVVVADNFAPLTDVTFGQEHFSAGIVMAGGLAFAFQIYCDFSGYSDIARGLARLLGFDIIWNFNLPYAATSPRDFWRRWHISLSNWLRDYLYISLGGNRRGAGRTQVNLILTMLLGGLWHGAAWNFVLWGLWHGLGLAGQRAWNQIASGPALNTSPRDATPSGCLRQRLSLTRILCWFGTMLFVGYGWLLFRATSWHQIAAMTVGLADGWLPPWMLSLVINEIVFALPVIVMEAWQICRCDRLVVLKLPLGPRALLQGLLLIGIVMFWQKKAAAFIYFQF